MKHITSRDNPHFKRIKALAHSSRERRKSGLALIEGTHLVAAYLEQIGAPELLAVSVTGQDNPEVAALMARAAGASLAVLTDALFTEASSVEAPAGILALVPPVPARPAGSNVSACLLLEDIQDPGNVGSLLRSAAAAGIEHVLMSPTCAFAWSPKVLRSAQGAHFSLNIVEDADIVAFVAGFAGQSVALAPRAKQAIYDLDMRQPTVFLIGNEGAGLSQALLGAASVQASIPMPGALESLNAAAAGAICLFELVRQRRRKA